MRTRSVATLALLAALAALAAGCGDDAVPTTDPGYSPTSEPTNEPTSAPTTSPAEPPGDLGPAFVAFARGGPMPPVAGEVELYLGNALTGVLTAEQARERRAWATCTEIGSYAARSCPLSPLTVLRGDDQVTFTDRPQGRCLPTYGPLPPDLRKLDRVVIVPTSDATGTCAQNFAIQLVADDGDLVAVSTLLGEP